MFVRGPGYPLYEYMSFRALSRTQSRPEYNNYSCLRYLCGARVHVLDLEHNEITSEIGTSYLRI